MGDETDDDDDVVDIEKEFIPPLTEKQIEMCLNPWDDISYEEEFYIFYDALKQMASDFNMVTRIGPVAMIVVGGDPAQAAAARDNALKASKAAEWLAVKSGSKVPGLQRGELIQQENLLDRKKLAWGRAVGSAIVENENKVLLAVWTFRFDEIMTLAALDWELCARVESIVFNTPDSQYENHADRCRVNAEDAKHRAEVLTKFKEDWEERWSNGQPHTIEDIQAAFDLYDKEHKEELRFLEQRKKAAYQRINKRLEEDPEYQKAKKTMAENSPIDALLRMLENGTDCNDPDCPVHGNNAKKERQKEEMKSLPAPAAERSSLSSKPEPTMQQIPRTKNDKEQGNIMAKSDNDKSDKKDEIKFTNISVQFVDDPNSKAIQLPNGMTYMEGRHWLQKIEDEETRMFMFEYKFTGWAPLDAMWAAYRALSELHGFVHIADFQNWFGPTPPSMITIEIDYGVTQQMPWGPIEVSGLSAPLVPGLTLVEGHPTLQFGAKIRNNERHIVDKLMKRTNDFLKTSSIYRGKAIEVDFEVVDPRDFRFDPNKAPKFWDTSKTNISELILSKQVERLIRTNIWTPIRKTEQARQHQIPLRRTTLLAGNYGVGKTLGARATAKIAQENGWTFLYLRNLNQLKAALYFARKYQPCVIFAEDINRITAGKRNEEMDALFNVIDGIDRKNDEVMLVFTTNNVEEIHPGMIRPGRIDTVITVTPPDADAAERLIRLYGRGLIDAGADLSKVGQKLAGQIPAIIREAVERSKLAAIEDNSGGPLVVSEEHLDIAADQMLEHAVFLQEPEEPKPDLVILGETLGEVIASGMRNYFSIGDDDNSDEETVERLPKLLLDQSGRPNAGNHGTVGE